MKNEKRTYSDYFYGVQMLYNMKFNSNITCESNPKNLNLEQNMVYNPPSNEQWNN